MIDEHDITGVVHLAALQVPFVREDPVAGAKVNVTGTVNVLEAVRRRGDGMAPVVYASSIAALPTEAGEYPGTLYGVFKLANEGTARRYFEDYGVSSVGLRPHTVYGPGRDQGLTSAPTAAMVAAAKGEAFTIPFGGALQFQYSADAGEAFVRASEAGAKGASVHNLDGPGRDGRGGHRGDRGRGARGGRPDHHRGRPAAVPAVGRLDVVRGARRRTDLQAVRGGRRPGDRRVQVSTAPSAAEPTDAA